MSAYVPVEIQRQVRARYANCCAFCRTAEVLTATVFEYDHIIPRAAGGKTTIENICLSCPMCNRYKSEFVSAPDPVTNTDTSLFHPYQQSWADHFGWNADGTEVVGLTAIGRVTVTALKMNRPAMIRVRKMWVAMGEHPPSLE